MPPGTHFNYGSGDTMMLSAMRATATRRTASDYAQEHLFGPLGMEATWWEDAAGNTAAFCCIDATAVHFAHFGQLYLDGGLVNGRRILSEQWIRDSWAPSAGWEGYGFQWWREGATNESVPSDTVVAAGVDGQWIFVIPSLDLVVVRMSVYGRTDVDPPVASPNIFAAIPPFGLIRGRGTAPPANWDHGAFLGPIAQSIRE